MKGQYVCIFETYVTPFIYYYVYIFLKIHVYYTTHIQVEAMHIYI